VNWTGGAFEFVETIKEGDIIIKNNTKLFDEEKLTKTSTS
jgi:hypothetical protein